MIRVRVRVTVRVRAFSVSVGFFFTPGFMKMTKLFLVSGWSHESDPVFDARRRKEFLSLLRT